MISGPWIFIGGLSLTGLCSFAVMFYIKPHLHKLLVDLCGTHERAGFWTAFSSVSLVLVPIICAMHFRPDSMAGVDPFYVVNDQLKWALMGLVGTVLMLGMVISRFIPRLHPTMNGAQPL